jgi:hypothetical protein
VSTKLASIEDIKNLLHTPFWGSHAALFCALVVKMRCWLKKMVITA